MRWPERPAAGGAWVRDVLRPPSMLAAVALALGALAAAALVASLIPTAQLGFGPFSLLGSLAVLEAACLAAGAIASRLAGEAPRHLSAAVTGLILFCVVMPPGTGIGYLGLGVVGATAVASKHVLAFRRQQLFNPAAVGLVVGSFTGIAPAGWWIATPVLAPVLYLVAIAMLMRIRHLGLAAVTLAVGALVTLLVLLGQGTEPAKALQWAFLSYPTAFLAAFMVTEPATLPPRRWQRLAVGAGVGALSAAQLSIVGILVSPELALLLGNLAGLGWRRLRRPGARVIRVLPITGRVRELVFETAASLPPAIGQHAELGLGPGCRGDRRGLRRTLTLLETGVGTARFAIDVPERPSAFKAALLSAPSGTEVRIRRVAGDFTLPSDLGHPVALIGLGIGVTPFVAYARSGRLEGRDAVVIIAPNSSGELPYAAELARHAPVLALADSVPAEAGEARAVGAGRLDQDALNRLIPDLGRRRVFVSGPPGAVAAVAGTARRAGAGRIATDVFLGA